MTLSLNDRGLDLVLGGGLRWIERVPGRSGATILLRGEAGAGKTLTALHIARSLALHLNGDVAWTGVEILPSEVAAQFASLWPNDPTFAVQHRNSPKLTHARRILARVLPTLSDPAQLGDALETLWPEFAATGAPRVLVIDSLTDGYGLGAAVPRAVADAICKLAAHWNVALILVEEARLGEASPWPYAVDTVLELRAAERGVRTLSVAKHRFAPSDAGPHALSFVTQVGARVSPRVGAWPRLAPVPKSPPAAKLLEVPPLKQNVPAHTVAAFGPAATMRRYAESLLKDHNPTLLLDLTPPPSPSRSAKELVVRGIWHPDDSPDELLRDIVDLVEAPRDPPYRSVILGDLRSLLARWSAEVAFSFLAALQALLRRQELPLVLVETTAARTDNVSPESFHPSHWTPRAGSEQPLIASLADITAEAVADDFAQRARKELPIVLTDRRSGESVLTTFPFGSP